jgi:hypothetical protein
MKNQFVARESPAANLDWADCFPPVCTSFALSSLSVAVQHQTPMFRPLYMATLVTTRHNQVMEAAK